MSLSIHNMSIRGWARGLLNGAIIAASLVSAANAEPSRPTDDALVLATVAPGAARDASPLRAAQVALLANPNDPALATTAARLAIEDGRRNADPRRYGQAQAALSPWWSSAAPPPEIMVLRAVIRQAYHDFAGASADFDAILAQAPANAQARLSRAFVRMVTGDTAGAAEDCSSLPPRLAPIIMQVCIARVEALIGAGAKGRDRLRNVLGQDKDPMQQFARAVLADLSAGLGETQAAEQLYRQVTASGEADAPLLAAYADLLLDLDRPAEVLRLLDGQGEADILLLRRAIAAKRAGDARLEKWSAILSERFAAALAGGVRVHLREEARYRLEVLGDAPAALALAKANWQVQKEPADARLLIECAIAAGDPAAAEDVKAFVSGSGLDDARVNQAITRLEGRRS